MPVKLLIFLLLLCLDNTELKRTSATVTQETLDDILDLDSITEENAAAGVTSSGSATYSAKYTVPYHETMGNSKETIKHKSTTETSTKSIEDTLWMSEAVKDIAYYLRAYRFNEYDRRYTLKPPEILGQYFSAFPKPPLRSLHWEVNQYCDASFEKCIRYLASKIKNVILRREEDTVYVIKEMNWTFAEHEFEIKNTEATCWNYSRAEFWDATPFEGPLERYQWRTTASYYMCWYTMMEEPSLMHFGEPCDNYAHCLSSFNVSGLSNGDPRAKDNEPFSCALYSFCPDPCCPIRNIKDFAECFASSLNPCLLENQKDLTRQNCSMKRTENRDFRDIILNRFNVSCHCPKKGFVWESRYGFCVDVDECTANNHNCVEGKEVCVNTLGNFTCGCNWGFVWDKKISQCSPSAALNVLKREKEYKKMVKEQPVEVTSLSLFKNIARIVSAWFAKSNCLDITNNSVLIILMAQGCVNLY